MRSERSVFRKNRLKIVIGFVAAAAIAAAAIILAWRQGAFLPRWITWEEKTLRPAGEVKSDAELPSEIVLQKRRVTVYRDGKSVWTSDRQVPVQDFLWCDIDHDGAEELLLLCWRVGRYGDAKPFWVERDERRWSQHIDIYDWRERGIHALWMASDIGMDVSGWRFDERDRLVITETSGRQTGWDWQSWGLSLIREYK